MLSDWSEGCSYCYASQDLGHVYACLPGLMNPWARDSLPSPLFTTYDSFLSSIRYISSSRTPSIAHIYHKRGGEASRLVWWVLLCSSGDQANYDGGCGDMSASRLTGRCSGFLCLAFFVLSFIYLTSRGYPVVSSKQHLYMSFPMLSYPFLRLPPVFALLHNSSSSPSLPLHPTLCLHFLAFARHAVLIHPYPSKHFRTTTYPPSSAPQSHSHLTPLSSYVSFVICPPSAPQSPAGHSRDM